MQIFTKVFRNIDSIAYNYCKIGDTVLINYKNHLISSITEVVLEEGVVIIRGIAVEKFE